MHSRIGCSVVCLSVLSITAGCCFSPATEEPNDLPSTAPHLNGTWEAVVDGEMMLQMYLDSTGDPIWASVSPTLIEGGLPVDLPDPILLDGQSYDATVAGSPFPLYYVGRAQAGKDNAAGPILAGQAVWINVELSVYASLSVPIQLPVLIATAEVTFQGRFTQADQADGTVRVVVDLSNQAQQIIDALGIDIPSEGLNEVYSGVQLVRR